MLLNHTLTTVLHNPDLFTSHKAKWVREHTLPSLFIYFTAGQMLDGSGFHQRPGVSVVRTRVIWDGSLARFWELARLATYFLAGRRLPALDHVNVQVSFLLRVCWSFMPVFFGSFWRTLVKIDDDWAFRGNKQGFQRSGGSDVINSIQARFHNQVDTLPRDVCSGHCRRLHRICREPGWDVDEGIALPSSRCRLHTLIIIRHTVKKTSRQ